VTAASSGGAGTAMGAGRGRARNGEYTRGGTRLAADATGTWRDGEGGTFSVGRARRVSADAAAMEHLVVVFSGRPLERTFGHDRTNVLAVKGRTMRLVDGM